MSENALLAAQKIVGYMDGWGVLFPIQYENPLGEQMEITYEGAMLMIESIIAHQYGEEPRDESIPFTD